MKKVFSIISILVLMFVACSCRNNTKNVNTEENTEVVSDSTEVETLEVVNAE